MIRTEHILWDFMVKDMEFNLKFEDIYLAEDINMFDQHSANQGFLFLLFFLTLVISDETPKFFAIENIDTAFNPKLCREIIKRLVGLAKKHDKQIIATTNNPAILDGLDLRDDEQKLMVVQRSIDGYTKVRTLKKEQVVNSNLPLSQNGCGVIATYNVLYHLTKNETIDFPSIIRDLENDGIILNGAFGTSMIAIQDYFNKLGFKVTGSSKVEDFGRIGFLNDATILTVFNNVDDITDAMHYMAITKKDGIYKVHNNGARDGAIKYLSVDDVLKRINSGKAKGVYLIGISNN